MTMKMTKEWLLKNAERDKDLEFSTGYLSKDRLDAVYRSKEDASDASSSSDRSCRIALANMVSIRRRSLGWTIEHLADKADVEVKDVRNLELAEPACLSVRTLHNLSGVLNLPQQGLFQLSGKTKKRSESFNDETVRFAARSQTAAKPTKQELQILEEYVKYLAAQQGK